MLAPQGAPGGGSNPLPAARLPRWVAQTAAALDWLASFCMLAAGIMMVALIALFGWLVFGRYVLNDTPTWVEQASLLLIVWITFLGAGVGVWRNTHLSIEFVRDTFPPAARHALSLAADALLAAFGATMAYYGTSLALGTSRRLIPMLGIAESWRAVPLAICGVLTVVFAVAGLLIRLAGSDRSQA